MARFSLWLLAYGGVLSLVPLFHGHASAFLWFLFWGGLIVTAVYYVVRWIRAIRQHLLWRVRRRLLITYLFIAVVPVVLILVLTGLAAVIFNGQFAAYLASLQLRQRYDELLQLNRVVAYEARAGRTSNPAKLLGKLKSFYTSELSRQASSYPSLEITLRIGKSQEAFHFDGSPVSDPPRAPPWLASAEFAGIVIAENHLALRAVNRGPTPAGELTIILSEPFTPSLLNQIGKAIGPVGVVIPERRTPANQQPGPGVIIHSDSIQTPPPASLFDFKVVGAASLNPIVWNDSKMQRAWFPVVLFASSRVFTLNRKLLSTLGPYSRVYVVLFGVVGVIFLGIELTALVTGIRLARTITTTVDRLQFATERVKAGEFSYRVKIPAHDQLSALGEAFDGMTASVERLLREAEEKSRLQSEIEIAREVQRQLFPSRMPVLEGFEIHAVCHAARGVSGDYYDFLPVNESQIGIVLGDVSGKGISAALLMASLQSALRAQHFAAVRTDHSSPLSTAAVLRRVNRQMADNTAAEKYATLFYAVYDAAAHQLTYTNAGHPAPFLLRGNRLERLSVGGTPVGLIPSAAYQEARIQLEAGDLLIIYSDGVTEPENFYDEEFGEAQLEEVARRAAGAPLPELIEEITRSVNDWTGSPQLQDDMTLIVGRAGDWKV